MDRLFTEKVFGVPWTVLAVVALLIALAYVVVDTSGTATGVVWIIKRWFHSLCWMLLALAAVAMARVTPIPQAWVSSLGIAGGVTYAIFILTSTLVQGS